MLCWDGFSLSNVQHGTLWSGTDFGIGVELKFKKAAGEKRRCSTGMAPACRTCNMERCGRGSILGIGVEVREWMGAPRQPSCVERVQGWHQLMSTATTANSRELPVKGRMDVPGS